MTSPKLSFLLFLLLGPASIWAFLLPCQSTRSVTKAVPSRDSRTLLEERLSKSRREQLGVADDEDEYDLGAALNANTDPLISKIIAGSFIVVMIGLLVLGVVVPSLTDYGEGVCNPIQNAGRC